MSSPEGPTIVKATGRQPGTAYFRSGSKKEVRAKRQAMEAASFDLLAYLWRRRMLIGSITLLGSVAGLIAAFVITPLYKSEVIMFPALTNSPSKALLNEQSTGRDDILGLGDEEDSEQLLQILHSDKI